MNLGRSGRDCAVTVGSGRRITSLGHVVPTHSATLKPLIARKGRVQEGWDVVEASDNWLDGCMYA